MSKPVSVVIKKSTKPEKKMMAIFTLENGKNKTVHFGASGMSDYTITKNKEQRARYIARHRKNENWESPMTAGSLAKHILWGAFTSKEKNISAFKRKFKLK